MIAETMQLLFIAARLERLKVKVTMVTAARGSHPTEPIKKKAK